MLVVSDIAIGLAYTSTELALGASGASEEEKTAVRAGIAVTAAATGASTVAAGAAAQIAITAANAALDSAGVEEDSPLRQAVIGSIQTASSLASGGVNVGTVVKAAVERSVQLGAAAAEEAGLEGVEHLTALSSVVTADGQGAIDAVGTLASLGGAAVGAAAGAGLRLATDSGVLDEELFSSIGAGAQAGASAGRPLGSAAQGDLEGAGKGGLDVLAQAGLAAGMTARAEAEGDATVERAVGIAGRFSVSRAVDGLGGNEFQATEAVLGVAPVAVEAAKYTEVEARMALNHRLGWQVHGFEAAAERFDAAHSVVTAPALSQVMDAALERRGELEEGLELEEVREELPRSA